MSSIDKLGLILHVLLWIGNVVLFLIYLELWNLALAILCLIVVLSIIESNKDRNTDKEVN